MLFTALALITGCVNLTGSERSVQTSARMLAAGWQEQTIKAGVFELRAFNNQQPAADSVLTVYIEGDGQAWIDGQFPADDPTPITPVALDLALQQPGGAVAYLGRPCQYLGAGTNPACTKQIWTDARFSEAVIVETNAALSQLKSQTKAKRLQLVGFSGGAAVALLIATRRDDVSRIITVAGNLDPHAWAKHLRLQPLAGSLDTVSVVAATQNIPQIDFVGGKDKVVPLAITEAFVKRYPVAHRPIIVTVPENGHVCCWVQQWPKLWKNINHD